MGFVLKTVDQIVDDMIATAKAEQAASSNPNKVTDYSRGGANRSFLEACAMIDADQYIQIAKLRRLFSIDSAKGEDLDARALDFGRTRKQPKQSIGQVVVGDKNVVAKVSSTTTGAVSAGDTSATIASATGWPASGTAIFERDTSGQRESVPFTLSGTTLTLGTAFTKAHPSGSSVILSQQGTDHTISAGQVVSVPKTTTSQQIDFKTTAATSLLDGDVSASAPAVSALTGALTKVAAGQISAFASLPWPTATVTNTASFEGGEDLESDDAFRSRIKAELQTLSRGTILAIKQAALEVSLPTGQRVVSAQVVEDNTNNQVLLYIDDGNGTASSTATQADIEIILFGASSGQKRAKLSLIPVQAGTLNLVKSDRRGVLASVTPGSGTADVADSAASFDGTEAGRVFVDANGNTFTVDSVVTSTTLRVTVPVGSLDPVVGAYGVLSGTALAEGSDYIFNETTGDIELTVGLVDNDVLAAVPNAGIAYTYYTGLIAEVQRVINGDPADFATYPGVRAAGTKVKVLAPNIVNVSFTLSLSSVFGVTENTLYDPVKAAIVAYVNNLGIGDDVVLAKVVSIVMSAYGAADVKILLPTSNVVVGDGQLARTSLGSISIS